MKSWFTFLLLLVLALPGRAWQGAVECREGGCKPAVAAAACPCCEHGGCHCAAEKDESPAAPLQAPSPRPVSAGDPVFFVSVEDFTLCPLQGEQGRKDENSVKPAVVSWNCMVPLYRRHCAMLC